MSHTRHDNLLGVRDPPYDRLSVGRRLELHRQLSARLEAGYQASAAEHTAELAMHYDRGRD